MRLCLLLLVVHLALAGRQRRGALRAPVEGTTSRHLEELNAWIGTDTVSVARCSKRSEGLCLIAAQPIEVGSTVLEGKEFILSPQSVDSTEVGRILRTNQRRTGEVGPVSRMALYILHERARADPSAWGPYLRALPGRVHCGITFPAEILATLEHTPLVDTIRRRRAAYTAEYHALFPHLSVVRPDVFPSDAFSLDVFLNAVALVVSRSVWLSPGNAEPPAPVIFPPLDFRKHCAAGMRVSVSQGHNGGMVWKSTAEYSTGQELCVSYERMSNADLLLSHGIAVEANDADMLLLEAADEIFFVRHKAFPEDMLEVISEHLHDEGVEDHVKAARALVLRLLNAEIGRLSKKSKAVKAKYARLSAHVQTYKDGLLRIARWAHAHVLAMDRE